jgi:hypothetical protein
MNEEQKPFIRVIQLDDDRVLDEKGRILPWWRRDCHPDVLAQLEQHPTAQAYYCGLCRQLMPLSHFPH